MSSLKWSRAPPAALRHQPPAPTRKTSDAANQVIPFYLDDGTDDIEEIRRRRYSSSASSSSDSDYGRQHNAGGRGGSRHNAGANKRRPHARSRHEKDSEWEKASSGRAEDEDDHTSDSDSSSHEHPATAEKKPHRQDQPESPRRTGRKKTQQSESESDDGDDDEEEDLRKDSAVSATTTTTTTTGVPSTASAPSTPRALAAGELASLSKLAVFPGSESQLLQAHVRRVKTLLHSQYHFYIGDQLILMAEKQPKSRTPNYYLFDMTRAAAGITTKLNKKSGNYIGKLRSNFTKNKSVLIGNQSRKTELASVIFCGNVSSSEPRRLVVVLPPLNTKRQEVDGIAVGDEPDIFSILAEHYKSLKKQKQLNVSQHHVQVFENKQPVFENGFYRLNFHGRVSVPSIKNFQLVRTNEIVNKVPIVAKTAAPATPASGPDGSLLAAREDGATVYLQFGKVDENKFHLDFRAPVTPIQAFAIALAQFNL